MYHKQIHMIKSIFGICLNVWKRCFFFIHTISDDLDAVDELIYYVNLASDDGETALDRAAKFGREKIVELLLQNGANIDPIETNRYAPLNAAASNGKRNSLSINRREFNTGHN